MTTATPPGDRVPASLLLPTQLVFNIGFYAVVPFLALVMTEDLGLGTAAVGLVLGARTVSQQGMFLLGGALADHWGPRRSIVVGCVVRALGYLGLATADDVGLFLLGAVLTGVGGAFFSPAVESLVGALDQARSAQEPAGSRAGRPRSLFAWLVLFGEVGAVLGPLIGLALLPLGFPIVAASAGCLFLIAGAALRLLLPPSGPLTAHGSGPADTARDGEITGSAGDGEMADPAGDSGPIDSGRRRPSGDPSNRVFACLGDRRFLAFAALFAVNLLAYNQLYFTLPLELAQDSGGVGPLALMFMLASVLTISLQLPVSAAAARLGPTAALRAGFTCIAAGFGSMVLFDAAGPQFAPHLPALTGPALLVVLLTLGHMLVGPVGLQQVHGFAGSRPLGAYYGLLASCGGVAVLIGNLLVGALRDTLGSAAGWGLLVLLATATAILLPRFLPVSSVVGPAAGPAPVEPALPVRSVVGPTVAAPSPLTHRQASS